MADGTTRREFVAGSLAAMALITIGSGDEAAATATPETVVRSVETPLGVVEVPVDPQRVIVLGEEFMLADVLDLGIRPIASTSSIAGAFLGMGRFDVQDIEMLSNTELDVERVLALQPDLMLVYTFLAEAIGFDVLSQIAPTVAVDAGDFRAVYLTLAAALGKEDIAVARLAEYDAAANAAGLALNASSRGASVISIYPGASIAVWVGGPVDLPQALLDMGFHLNPDATTLPPTGSQNRAYISLEELGVLAGDDLMMLQSSAIEGEDTSVSDVTTSEVWQLIPAVAAGRVHVVDRFGYPGVPGRLALIDELRTLLALPAVTSA
jgi:iron complex transport system substrate-binding protein